MVGRADVQVGVLGAFACDECDTVHVLLCFIGNEFITRSLVAYYQELGHYMFESQKQTDQSIQCVLKLKCILVFS